MTDRVHSLQVVLDKDLRTDDAEATIAAIRQIRGVLSVNTVLASADSWMAEERAKQTLRLKLYEILK